jgi:hypothetical protein
MRNIAAPRRNVKPRLPRRAPHDKVAAEQYSAIGVN